LFADAAAGEPAGGAGVQAALFARAYGLYALWQSWGIEPSLVLGYGAGEYAAACAAGVFGLEDGLNLALAHGRLWETMMGQGEAAVLAGEKALASFAALAAGIKYQPPRLGIVSPCTGELMGEEPGEADYWVRQASAPLHFTAGLATLKAQGIGTLLTLGPEVPLPGGDLPESSVARLPSLRAGAADWAVLLQSLGELYVQGITPDWQGFDRNRGRRKLALPTYPFQRQRYWLEGTAGGR
jgi:acyl transferase domain-containing protein